MHRIIIFFTVLLMSGTALAAPVERQGEGRMLNRGGDIPQGFSPNGLYSSSTANNATYHNLTSYLAGAVYCPSNCSIRFLPSAAKGAYVAVTIPGGSWHTFVKNTATPFVNISSNANAAHHWLQQ